MKTFLMCIVSLSVLVLFGAWFVFYKGEPLTNAAMVTVCLHKTKLKVTTTESAKVFTSCESEISHDTLKLFVKTAVVNTLVEHPVISGEFDIAPNIKFVTIADKTIPVGSIKNCRN